MTAPAEVVCPLERVDRRLPDGRRERGWIRSCPFGGRHLTGPSFAWWRCPTCAAHTAAERRAASAGRLAAKRDRLAALYFPGASA